MYKNSTAPSNNITLWQYLGTKHLDFRYENNNTSGVLIKKILYILTQYGIYAHLMLCVYVTGPAKIDHLSTKNR